MVVKVAQACPSRCGVHVTGEVDTATREFVHQFTLPSGSEAVLKPRRTEVERVRLVTFGPGTRLWSVECPICGKAIVVMNEET